MSGPVSLFSPPAPVCRPGDDPLADVDAPGAAPNPLEQASPAWCPVATNPGSHLPAPDHPVAKAAASAPAALPHDEQVVLNFAGPAALKLYQQDKAEKREVQEAHRVFVATGQITQTKTPFAWIEILLGKPMTRSERYDAMLAAQGKPIAVKDDVDRDERDPVFLTKDEFDAEFWARETAEWNQCADDYIRPGKIHKCQRAVNEKYGGESFVAWRSEQEALAAAQWREVSARIDGVANSGAVATAGRLIGGVAGWATGHDMLTWSEHGAAIGGLGDAALPLAAAKVQHARANAAHASSGATDGIGAEPITRGYGKGGTRLSPEWATRERGRGQYDCVAATCARSLREGAITNSDEVLTRAGWSPAAVHETRGLNLAQARQIFKESGKVLGDPVKGIPTEKGDYAVITYTDGRPKHMVYLRVLGPRDAAGTQPRGFYIDDAQMGVRFQGDAARGYLQRPHEIYPIADADGAGKAR